MAPCCNRRHRLSRGGAALWLLAVWGAPGVAQQRAKPRIPSRPVPRTIVLPSNIVAGASATLAVLDSQGRLLPDAVVELSTGEMVTTNETGRAVFRAPNVSGTLDAKIPGRAVSSSAPVAPMEVPAPQPASESETPRPIVNSYPHVLAVRDRFTIEGTGFRGEADADRVFLGDQLCLVLAASPNSLVVLPAPRVPIGDVTLRIVVDGRNAGQFTVAAVLLEFSGPAEPPNAGATGKLVLRAHGTAERLNVDIRNTSPGVIQLLKGNPQRVTTSGGEENTAPVEVKFLSGGDYMVVARLISAEAEQLQPDIGSARQRLLEARGLASGVWSVRIDRLLLMIDSEPLDLAKLRAGLKSLLDDKPAASVAVLLNSAWQELKQP